MADGSVKLRGTTWSIIIPYRDPLTGVYKRKWERASALGFPNTERGAQQALRKRLVELDEGVAPFSASRVTLAAYLEQYIATRRTRRNELLKPITRFNYRTMAAKHITPHLGATALRDLTPPQVRRWLATLESGPKPLSAGTVRITWALLHGALRQAVADRLITHNPCDAARPVMERATPKATLTPEQMVAFLALIDGEPLAALWRLLALAGLRVGEVIGLRWEDVDLTRGVVLIQRTLTRDDRGARVVGTSPKSSASRAAVSVPPSIVAALKVQRDRQGFERQRAGVAWVEGGYVFTRADGRPLNYTTLRKQTHALGARVGVPGLAPHGLRHAAAIFALAENQHPRVVQARLRHASLDQTMRYMQVLAPISAQAAADLDVAVERVARQVDDEAARESRG